MSGTTVLVLLACAGVLFALGLWCLAARANLVRMVLGLELLGKGAALVFIVGGRGSGDLATAQAVVVTLIVLEASIAAVALALAVQAKRRLGTLDADSLDVPEGGGAP